MLMGLQAEPVVEEVPQVPLLLTLQDVLVAEAAVEAEECISLMQTRSIIQGLLTTEAVEEEVIQVLLLLMVLVVHKELTMLLKYN